MASVYVLNVPEFVPLVEFARLQPHAHVSRVDADYWVIAFDGEMVFDRRKLGLKPAVWYGMFTGGIDGEIKDFTRDTVRVVGANREM